MVVNTVKRAQALFLEFRKLLHERGDPLEIRCLHSQLFESERSETEKWVLQRFAKESSEKSLLIATQVVEAGLDISADVLLTELCQANALLQRVGRCARFEGEKGTVHVCSVEGEQERRNRPYEPKLMEKTELFLKRQEAVQIQMAWEQELIEFVHGDYDAFEMEVALSHVVTRKGEIDKAYVTGVASMIQLVRSVDNVGVLVHSDPTQLRLELRPERVSVNFHKVYGFLRKHFAQECGELLPVGWYPDVEQDQWQREVIIWKEIRSEGDLYGKRLICLAPSGIHYKAGVGLLFEPPEDGEGVFSQERLSELAQTWKIFDYYRETYREHVQGIRGLYQEQELQGVHVVANERLSKAIQSARSVSFQNCRIHRSFARHRQVDGEIPTGSQGLATRHPWTGGARLACAHRFFRK